MARLGVGLTIEADGSRARAALGILAWTAWLGVAALLIWAAALYASYVIDIVNYPFGLNYSEGLIWQQALWMPGPHMYGDISRYPFLVFEYPPMYHIVIRVVAAAGLDMLAAGRGLSAATTVLSAALIALFVHRLCAAMGRVAAALAAGLAGMLPFVLVPIISWSVLLRVDMLALAFTWTGVVLAQGALRRPALLYLAILSFVAACYTKQTFVAAPIATLTIFGMRDLRLAVRAGAVGFVTGVAVLAALSVLTSGGFLRHILAYNINRFSFRLVFDQAATLLSAYPGLAGLVVTACVLAGRRIGRVLPGEGRSRMRLDDPDATVLFLLIYLALSTITLLFAGKSGAAINYFIEFLCLWCVWIGWLAGYTVRAFSRFPAGAVCLPIILVAQLYTLPANIQLLHRLQLSPARKAQAESLLNRVRLIPGPLLSDDMVLVRRAGRDVGLEPAILAELAAQGQWDETKLIDMLRRHAFGAVVTAYDPGDPTFDARYLAATRKALLESYPHVEMFGDYRLRLP